MEMDLWLGRIFWALGMQMVYIGVGVRAIWVYRVYREFYMLDILRTFLSVYL
jgi:hypothetical protein